ncbi:MAG: hypothetical protein ACE5GY_00570 [Thermodesulfobacteriota bacterium]
MLDIDITLLYQMIGFVVLLFIMNNLLYKPLLKILKERDERIDGTLKNASRTEKEVEEGLKEYEQRLKEATVKGVEARNKIRQEALDAEKEILDAAREKAAGEMAVMKRGLEKSKRDALDELKAETKTLSRSIAEKILDRKVVVALFAFVLPLLPLLARAAEEAHHEAGGNTMLWKIVNFVILAVVVVIVWKKFIGKMLVKRSADIKQAMEDAKAAKEAADARAAEYATKLSMLERRMAEIHEELEAGAEAEKKKILAEAEAAAVKIMEQAKLTAEQEVKKAKAEIRAEVASLTVRMAEELLNKELKPDDQEKLVKGYLDNLRLN